MMTDDKKNIVSAEELDALRQGLKDLEAISSVAEDKPIVPERTYTHDEFVEIMELASASQAAEPEISYTENEILKRLEKFGIPEADIRKGLEAARSKAIVPKETAILPSEFPSVTDLGALVTKMIDNPKTTSTPTIDLATVDPTKEYINQKHVDSLQNRGTALAEFSHFLFNAGLFGGSLLFGMDHPEYVLQAGSVAGVSIWNIINFIYKVNKQKDMREAWQKKHRAALEAPNTPDLQQLLDHYVSMTDRNFQPGDKVLAKFFYGPVRKKKCYFSIVEVNSVRKDGLYCRLNTLNDSDFNNDYGCINGTNDQHTFRLSNKSIFARLIEAEDPIPAEHIGYLKMGTPLKVDGAMVPGSVNDFGLLYHMSEDRISICHGYGDCTASIYRADIESGKTEVRRLIPVLKGDGS